ncbi:recombinase RecT [Alicyclobacillus fodiniaquatilis]|uniref:Recombinase RecT n=1 Tax=Alicyclobacillus fodiniaquatilis TaxID=1661150 RepID=A0ABW4JHP5_9BACL
MAETALAITKKDTVDVVASKIRQFQERGEIHFPPNYSPENAMKSAWLNLQAITTGKADGYKPVLQVCTKDSIANALLDMVVQGLNPAKKQCYFIAYGKQLVCQRSYFGTMAVTKNNTNAKEIFAEVVYEDDDFEFQIRRGRKQVTKHVQTMESLNKAVIIGAYCTIVMDDDTEFTDFMTVSEIRQAWKQSKNNPDSEGSVHNKFPAEMAKKTVINRACKALLNSSDDSGLVMQHVRRNDDIIDEVEMEAEIAENANQQPIDVDYQYSEDTTEREEPKKEPTKEVHDTPESKLERQLEEAPF